MDRISYPRTSIPRSSILLRSTTSKSAEFIGYANRALSDMKGETRPHLSCRVCKVLWCSLGITPLTSHEDALERICFFGLRISTKPGKKPANPRRHRSPLSRDLLREAGHPRPNFGKRLLN